METEFPTPYEICQLDREFPTFNEFCQWVDFLEPDPLAQPTCDIHPDEPIYHSLPNPPPTKEVIEMLDTCISAWGAIEDPKPCDTDDFGFDFDLVFRPWFKRNIPAWPEGSMQEYFRRDINNWVDVYHRVEDGPPILAFICKEGVIVAGKRATHMLVKFNSHVIGCVAGDVAQLDYLPCKGTALEISKDLALKHSSPNGKDSSGIVIAGWDDKGPSLYRLDSEGKLHQGVMFACGSCSENGYSTVGLTGFPYMSITTAAKLARVLLPTTIVESRYYNGGDATGVIISENGKIGDFVEVHCVGRDGYKMVADTDEEVVDSMEALPEPRGLKHDAVAAL